MENMLTTKILTMKNFIPILTMNKLGEKTQRIMKMDSFIGVSFNAFGVFIANVILGPN